MPENRFSYVPRPDAVPDKTENNLPKGGAEPVRPYGVPRTMPYAPSPAYPGHSAIQNAEGYPPAAADSLGDLKQFLQGLESEMDQLRRGTQPPRQPEYPAEERACPPPYPPDLQQHTPAEFRGDAAYPPPAPPHIAYPPPAPDPGYRYENEGASGEPYMPEMISSQRPLPPSADPTPHPEPPKNPEVSAPPVLEYRYAEPEHAGRRSFEAPHGSFPQIVIPRPPDPPQREGTFSKSPDLPPEPQRFPSAENDFLPLQPESAVWPETPRPAGRTEPSQAVYPAYEPPAEPPAAEVRLSLRPEEGFLRDGFYFNVPQYPAEVFPGAEPSTPDLQEPETPPAVYPRYTETHPPEPEYPAYFPEEYPEEQPADVSGEEADFQTEYEYPEGDFPAEDGFSPEDDPYLSGYEPYPDLPDETAPSPADDIRMIGGRLEVGIIISEMLPEYTENNLSESDGETYLTFDGATSIYNMKFQNGNARPLYGDISLGVLRGSCTAFIADTPLDVHALLRATKNGAGLKDGAIKVGGKNSENSPNLLYIENDSMVTFGMTSLEFLMLCLSEVRDYPAAKQEKLYRVLEDAGLSDIALADTKLLTRFQRIALLLVTAAMSNLIDGVVLNPNKLPVDMADEFVIRQVFGLLHRTGKTVLLAGNNMMLTALAANRVAALRDGKLFFEGSFSEFVDSFSDFCFSFPMESESDFAAFAAGFPHVRFTRANARVSVRIPGGNPALPAAVAAAAIDAGVEPRDILTGRKSFHLAMEGMVNT